MLQHRLNSDASSAKIFRLYLGEEGFMNEMGVYPCENFYDLRLCMRFRNTQEMLLAMRSSGLFGHIVCKDDGCELALYSPLWYEGATEMTRAEWDAAHHKQTIFDDTETDDTSSYASKTPSKTPSKMPSKMQSPYNIYTLSKNNTKEKENNNIRTDELLEGFFKRLLNSEAQKKALLGPVADKMRQMGKLDNAQAEEAVAYLCSHQLTNYFLFQETRLRGHKYSNWLIWLRGLLHHKYAGQLITQALQEYTALLKKRTAEQARRERARREEERRSFQPNSPFEWTDRTSGKRQYDDPYDGVVSIPNDAPPRPTPGCAWHPMRNVWFEGGKAL